MLFAFLNATSGQQDIGWNLIIMLVAMFAIMYFFMIRPQQKKQKEAQNFRNSLTVGQEVITIGGIYGVVRNVDMDGVVTLEVASGVKIRVHKDGINPVASPVGGDK